MKIGVVIGTRPELTKGWSVVKALRERGADVEVWLTGQHTDLLRSTLEERHRRVLAGCPVGAHAAPRTEIIVDTVAAWVRAMSAPMDYALVIGDTASAYGAALGAQCPVIHVEAGVRSGNLESPYPEEGYRIAIDQKAAMHFPATAHAAENLRNEGIDPGPVVGNPGIDDLMEDNVVVAPERLVLLTLHRRETLPRLGAIVHELDQLAGDPSVRWVWPAHPNPVIRAVAETGKYIEVVDPLPVSDFRALMAQARLVVTDSGGVQEEAAALGVPCCVVRDVTDRPESVEAKRTRVVGTVPEDVRRLIFWELAEPTLIATPFLGFGDGHAGQRIAEHLLP